MNSHDNYDLKVLKTLRKIVNRLDKIEKHLAKYKLDEVRVYDPAEYANEHPEWIKKITNMAYKDDIKIGNPIREDQLR